MTTRSNAIRATLPATRLNLDEPVISKNGFPQGFESGYHLRRKFHMHDDLPFSPTKATSTDKSASLG
jgi:hypothetical protein